MPTGNVQLQTTLFPEDICAKRHKDNPESRDAFETILPHLGRLQHAVLEYAAVRSPITVKMVVRDLEMLHQTAGARMAELKQQGLLEKTGQRRDACALLQITDLGKRTLLNWSQKS